VHWLDAQLSPQQLAWLERLSEPGDPGFLESICSPGKRFRVGVGVGVRSQLQIKLILHSLHPSSAKKQVRALL